MIKPVKFLRSLRYRNVDKEFYLDNCPVQKTGEEMSKDIHLSVPVKTYSAVGRESLILLMKFGLHSGSSVLDVGAGTLRTGYWVRHITPKYYAIEPNKKLVYKGIKAFSLPNFGIHLSDKFDMSYFNRKFDFVYLRSILSHTSKGQIQTILNEFLKVAHKDSVMLASYYRPTFLNRDYKGTEWVGRSHVNDKGGVVAHSFRWIKKECQKRGLSVRELKHDVINSQIWLYIKLKT